MKKKILPLFLLPLLLTSCQNSYLTTQLKYDSCELSFEIIDKNLNKQMVKKVDLDKDFSNRCISLYNNVLNNTRKSIIQTQGFSEVNFYCFSFNGEYNTSLLINKDNHSQIIVHAYTVNYNHNMCNVSNINNDIKQEIENIIPLLDNKLSLATWEESKNYC